MASKLDAPLLGKSGKVSLDPAIFGEPFNGQLVHEVVRAERAAKRRGTASTKTRGEVAMTGAKAWRQKGTGRARVGAMSTPQRRGGGVAFGPKPRDYVFKINRKVRRKALRAALSLHAERGTVAIVEGDGFSEPCTHDAAEALAKWRDAGSVVVLTAGDPDRNCELSFRNIDRVRAVLTPDRYGVAELTLAQNLVISKAALDELAAHTSAEVKRGDGPQAEDFEAKQKAAALVEEKPAKQPVEPEPEPEPQVEAEEAPSEDVDAADEAQEAAE
jgi:large subunit ribosomal protein L4